jgi:hypothetical protein
MKAHDRATAVGFILVSSLWVCLPAAAEDIETRDLSGFEAVAVGGGIDLVLRQGDRFVVEVQADDDASEIITEVRAGKLEIRRKQAFGFHWGDAGSVNVTLPKLVALTASGGSDVRGEGTLTGDALEIVVSGGSDVVIDVAVDTLELNASGGSDASLTGTARVARLGSTGGSDINAGRFTAGEVNVNSSGGSDIVVAVRDKISGHASGGSDIAYSGQPSSVDIDTSGGSDVRRR